MAGVDSGRFRTAAQAAPPGLPYGDADYWSARYAADTEPFDWYLRWEQLKVVLEPFLPPQDSEPQILVLGCGTSLLSERLYAEGYANVTNVDRCESAVGAMSARHAAQREAPPEGAAAKKRESKVNPEPQVSLENKPAMQFEVAEAQNLPQDWAERFDVIIDKGVLDSVSCSRDKWRGAGALLRSVCRVLKPSSGVYVCVSWAGPGLRGPLLADGGAGGAGAPQDGLSRTYGWRLTHQTVPRPLENPAADPKAKDKIELVPSPAFNAEEHVYHIYACRKM